MKKISEIESRISDFDNQLSKLTEQKNAAELRLEEARRAYSSSIVTADGDEATSAHRSEVLELTAHFEALAGAVVLVEDDLKKALNEKQIIELYQSDGKAYDKAWTTFQQSVNTLSLSLSELDMLQGEITSKIGNIFKSSEQIASILNGLDGNLDGTLSLKSFLAGNLEPTKDEIRTEILDAAGLRLKALAGTLEIPDGLNLTALSNLIGQLSGWQNTIATFKTGIDLVQNRKSLIPRIPKVNKHQTISVPQTPKPLKSYMPPVPPPRFDRNKPKGEQLIVAG